MGGGGGGEAWGGGMELALTHAIVPTTVEPPFNGHPQGTGKWPLNGGWPLSRGSS